MKKLIAMLVMMAVCCAMVLPVAAEEFVPSIPYKDYPEIVDKPEIKDEVEEEIEDVELVITPVSDAINTPEEDRDDTHNNLLDIYEQLKNDDMQLPIPDAGDTDKNYVIRDLIDVSVIDSDGQEVEDVASVQVTFDLGLADNKEVIVMVYENDQWHIVEDIIYNNNGSVTIHFDKMGPVVFVVEDDGQMPPSPTNDKMTRELITWSILMVASACAAVVMLISRRKARQ